MERSSPKCGRKARAGSWGSIWLQGLYGPAGSRVCPHERHALASVGMTAEEAWRIAQTGAPTTHTPSNSAVDR